MIDQSSLGNQEIRHHQFLVDMYSDTYFPAFLVSKCKAILLDLCQQIEQQQPSDLSALYALTHVATNHLNKLDEEFSRHNSELETVARECLAADFEFISIAYGFKADSEELIATRDW